MTEDQYYPSYLDEQTSNSTVNTGCDFNKYDPYVDKIRTLFVPSLESRIYSCLKTFVYREDQDTLSEPPYLKRCLDVAATWREPVYAFSTKLGDLGFPEKMLTQAVKYLIKDGLIDCFIDSTILNNRLNKVCRNLDTLGVEKDFLRYLAVWNYINEKDYWIENDSTASTSMFIPSYDSIGNYSDLDVQVGSGLDSDRTKRRYKQALKPPAIDSSKFACSNVKDFAENCCSPQFCSRLNIDSRKPECSKSSCIRKESRSISQTYPCQPSNCSSYRGKSFHQSNWDGKTLKLRVCKFPSNCRTHFDRGHTKPCRLSRLPLPCKFDDMIADIFKADHSDSRLSSTTMSKELRASVTDICRCVNKTLSKMSSEEVQRCRFHCEILPGSFTFKLFQRESNGYTACLFSDRITTDKIDGQFTSRGIPFSQKFENIEEENTDEFDVPILESTRVDLDDKDSRLVSSLSVETKSEVEPRFTNSICLPEEELNGINYQESSTFVGKKSSKKLSENHVNDQSCSCSTFFNNFKNPDNEEEGNTETNRVEGSGTTADRNNSVESPEKAALIQSSGNAIEDGPCYCNNSDDNELDISNRRPEKTEDIEVTKTENLGKKMIPLNRLSRNEAEDPTCCRGDSFLYTFSIDRDSEKNQESNYVGCLKTQVDNFETSNWKESSQDACLNIPDYQTLSSTNTGETRQVIDSVKHDQSALANQSRLSNLPSEVKSRNNLAEEIERDGIRRCQCPISCECINKRSDEHEIEQCDPKYSYDTGKALETSTALDHVSEDTRISPLVYSEQSLKVNSSISNFVRSSIAEKNKYFDIAGAVQLKPNCVKSEIYNRNLRSKNYQGTSTKSKVSLSSGIANTHFLDTKVEQTRLTRTNFKSVQVLIEQSSSSLIKQTKRRLSLPEPPGPLDTSQALYDDQHELGEYDLQRSWDTCGPSEKASPLNRGSNVSLISPLGNSERPPKVNSFMPNLLRPILITERQYVSATNVDLQPNYLKSESNNRDSHHSENDQDTSAKYKMSLPSAISKTPLSVREVEETRGTRTSFTSARTVTEELPSSVIKETKKTLSLARSPIRIDTGRASSSRSQRINILIELCSESSEDKSSKNEPRTMLPVCPNALLRSGVQDLPSMWRPRCHSADARISTKQAIFKSEKNTKDECLRHLRGINACLHSPPGPLESRDYLPSSQPLLRMGNPIVYGMSTKSERQSMRLYKERNNGLKNSKNNKNSRCCNEIQKNGRILKTDKLPNEFSPARKKLKNVSSSAINNNLCHAFSAGSVDRMKHLIKTKLRRILLERDKATNTPKTSLTNEKYRVSVPNGKTKRLPVSTQRCHTIWESRSASALTNTSKTYGSTGRILAKVSEEDEIKTLFYSTTNSKIMSSDRKVLKACQNSDETTCYCLRSSNQCVVSSRIIDQSLVGGSDAPCQKGTDKKFRYLWKQPQENVEKITNKNDRYVFNNCDDRFSSKSINRSCTGDSVVGDGSSKPWLLCSGADYEEKVELNERQDEIMKCPGKLDWSGNSTSRHIYLHEYDNFELSNNRKANKWCDPKICSPKYNTIPICKHGRTKKNSRKAQKGYKTNFRQANSRCSRRQFTGEQKMPRNMWASSFDCSKIHVVSNIKGRKAFGKLDQDLRSKLLQYVSLCKNVKYSLLKMLRPNDVYDVRRLSIPRANRYKFGDY